MSMDVSVFEAPNVPDPMLEPGWYVGSFDGDGVLADIKGPYKDKAAAVVAMLDGVWL